MLSRLIVLFILIGSFCEAKAEPIIDTLLFCDTKIINGSDKDVFYPVSYRLDIGTNVISSGALSLMYPGYFDVLIGDKGYTLYEARVTRSNVLSARDGGFVIKQPWSRFDTVQFRESSTWTTKYLPEIKRRTLELVRISQKTVKFERHIETVTDGVSKTGIDHSLDCSMHEPFSESGFAAVKQRIGLN